MHIFGARVANTTALRISSLCLGPGSRQFANNLPLQGGFRKQVGAVAARMFSTPVVIQMLVYPASSFAHKFKTTTTTPKTTDITNEVSCLVSMPKATGVEESLSALVLFLTLRCRLTP